MGESLVPSSLRRGELDLMVIVSMKKTTLENPGIHFQYKLAGHESGHRAVQAQGHHL